MPTGLSSTTQPCTSRFSRRELLRLFLLAGPVARLPRRRGEFGERSANRLASSLVLLALEVALDLRVFAIIFSIRSASSNRSSTRNRMSGANFRLTRRAISPRRNRLLRSSASSTVLDVRAAERHDVDRREPQVGAHAHLRHGDEWPSSTGSCTSPRVSISAIAWRISSPTRNWRCEPPGVLSR